MAVTQSPSREYTSGRGMLVTNVCGNRPSWAQKVARNVEKDFGNFWSDFFARGTFVGLSLGRWKFCSWNWQISEARDPLFYIEQRGEAKYTPPYHTAKSATASRKAWKSKCWDHTCSVFPSIETRNASIKPSANLNSCVLPPKKGILAFQIYALDPYCWRRLCACVLDRDHRRYWLIAQVFWLGHTSAARMARVWITGEGQRLLGVGAWFGLTEIPPRNCCYPISHESRRSQTFCTLDTTFFSQKDPARGNLLGEMDKYRNRPTLVPRK